MFVSLIIFFSGSLRSLASLPQRRGFLSATVTPLTGLSGLLHHCNTRYDWLVRPYSTGSFTLQETPSFAWRTNESVSRPPTRQTPLFHYNHHCANFAPPTLSRRRVGYTQGWAATMPETCFCILTLPRSQNIIFDLFPIHIQFPERRRSNLHLM